MNKLEKKNSKFLEYFFNISSLGTIGMFLVLIILLTFFTAERNFLRLDNIRNLLFFGSEFTIIVIGAGMLMIVGEFDLSVGSVLAFCSFVFVRLFAMDLNPFLVTIITLICGGVIGMINGLITTKGRILSFIATLGTMMFWRGITVLISGGIIMPLDTSGFKFFASAFIGKVWYFFPSQAVWLILFTVILGLILHRHRFGNWVFSTGDNEKAARSMAINTDKVKIICFIIVGFLVAFAAVIQTFRLGAFSSRVGTGWEFKVVAAAVVGGTSLRGGRGNMLGIFIGAFIIVIIENALVIARLPYEWTYVVFGVIILFSVMLDLFIERSRKRVI
ncbi:Ribose import permease protein RbsC [subsurface metagenome]